MFHGAEICLEESHIQDALVLTLNSAKGLAGSSLVNLDMVHYFLVLFELEISLT